MINALAREAIRDANLMKILGKEGMFLMLALTELCMSGDKTKEAEDISFKIFDVLDNKSWISGVMALFFALDMFLQNNPLKITPEEKEAVDNLIKDLEQKMRRGKTDEDKN